MDILLATAISTLGIGTGIVCGVELVRLRVRRSLLRKRLERRLAHLNSQLAEYHRAISGVRDEATKYVVSMSKESVEALYKLHVLMSKAEALQNDVVRMLTRNEYQRFSTAIHQIDAIIPQPETKVFLRVAAQSWERQIQTLLKTAAAGVERSRRHFTAVYC